VGRTAATVRNWERDQQRPSDDVVDALAVSLGVDADRIWSLLAIEPPTLTVVPESVDVDDEVEDDEDDAAHVDDETYPDDDVSAGDEAPVVPAEVPAVEHESASVGSAAELAAEAPPPEDAVTEVGEVESGTGHDPLEDDLAGFVPEAPDELGIFPRISAPPPPATASVPPPEVPPAVGAEMAEEEVPQPELPATPPPGIEDEPTQAIAPPIARPRVPVPTGVGPATVAVPAVTLAEPALPKFLAPLRVIFDPRKRWLYWIRATLTIVAMLILLGVLAWAGGNLFDSLGDLLDTIEPTDDLDSGLVGGVATLLGP
jgi:hypothetical protein